MAELSIALHGMFHDDWAKNVISRKTAPAGSHDTNVLTKFHENWAKNVTSRVFTCFHYIHIEKNALPTGGHVFSPIWTILELVQDINKTNVLTTFHDDRAKIVTARVFTSHVIQLTGTIFKLNSHIKETKVLTKFHENWAKNVTSRVFTCFHYIHIEKNATPTGGHVFSTLWTIFELVRDINKTNVLTNFHDDWTKIVTSLECLQGKLPPPGSHKTTVLTKFHENWAKNVTSRVFTCFHNIHIEKNAPPTGGHVFSPIWTIFEIVRDINKTNVSTNFHDDWAKIVTSRPNKEKGPPTGGHVFQQTGTTFELDQHTIKANILTNFKLDRDIIGKNLLTKVHEDPTLNVASKLFTNQIRTTDGRTDGRQTKTSHKRSPEQSVTRLTREEDNYNKRGMVRVRIKYKNGGGAAKYDDDDDDDNDDDISR
ncbi:hypothetical protein DPMN_165702 [Dreissena polymorpha]|uniref:Uncharacterized protein n=1 Tax=Dreissena polymorpha TaxID=45954 RepID=A0A9D4EXC9_DREPO|nr:hypothetical protein DPMN_165702 [Dreissena polymorpha]